MPGFEEALTETITNLRRGPPVPERRTQPQTQQDQAGTSLINRRAGEQTPDQRAFSEAGATPTSAVRSNLDTAKDAGSVLLDEVTLGVLPFLRAAVVDALSGEDVSFDNLRREFQREIEAARERLGEGPSAAIEVGSVLVPGGIGAKLAGRGREIVGGMTGGALAGGVRGATEDIEEPTLSGRRLGDAVQGAVVEGGTGAITGAALKGGRVASERIGEAVSKRRQSSKRQSNAEIRRRGQELTRRPGGQRALDVIDEQPEGFFAEIAQGVANNQSIEQIARRLDVSQDDVARTLLRNRDRFSGAVPGDRRLTNVEIGGENWTVNKGNVDRLVREARDITKTVDRFRELPPPRSRGQGSGRATRSQQTPAQARSGQQASSGDPIEQGRQDALTGRSQGAASQSARPAAQAQRQRATGRSLAGGDDTAQIARRAPEPTLPNSVRAQLAMRAIGENPRNLSKLEQIERVRQNIDEDNLPRVAEALGIDPSRDRLRSLVLNALDALRSPGVSSLTGASLLSAGAASQQDDN